MCSYQQKYVPPCQYGQWEEEKGGRGNHCEGLRLHLLLPCCCCCCLSILFASDLNSSTCWAGSLEAACSVAVI